MMRIGLSAGSGELMGRVGVMVSLCLSGDSGGLAAMLALDALAQACLDVDATTSDDNGDSPKTPAEQPPPTLTISVPPASRCASCLVCCPVGAGHGLRHVFVCAFSGGGGLSLSLAPSGASVSRCGSPVVSVAPAQAIILGTTPEPPLEVPALMVAHAQVTPTPTPTGLGLGLGNFPDNTATETNTGTKQHQYVTIPTGSRCV
jgi:hypothetical protein